MVEPPLIHWKASKHVLQYLKDIVHYGLRYVGDGELVLHGLVVFDWIEDVSGRKSTHGFVSTWG